MGAPKNTFWTNERMEQLLSLKLDCKTATQIAAVMHAPSRNAVCGKLARMGLVEKPKLAPVAALTPRKHRRRVPPCPPQPFQLPSPFRPPSKVTIERRKAAARLAERLVCEATIKPPNGGVTIIELTDRTCRYPFGEVMSEHFRYCGAHKKTDAGPYCPTHALAAHEPSRPYQQRLSYVAPL